MAQQVVIAGAMFNDVPSISVPDSNNVYHPFLDTTITSNAAAAGDIAQGKLAYVNGELVTGTNQGGGGGGLEYETGTWTPASNVSDADIPLSNQHSTAPFYHMIWFDENRYDGTTSTNYLVVHSNMNNISGHLLYGDSSGSTTYKAITHYVSRQSSTTTLTGTSGALISSTTWATNTTIRAYTGNASRYWRSGYTYKWIAVWAPTS